MRILDAFREWLGDAEEKEKFIKHWMAKHVNYFGSNPSDCNKEYHGSVAYDIAKMQALLDTHEQKLKDMAKAIESASKEAV